jgi:hypothetical protein
VSDGPSGSLTKESKGLFPQPLHVAHGWDAEEALVLSIEVGGVLVAHAISRTRRVEGFARNLFSGFSIAHLEDVQNQTIIFENRSITQGFGVSIIPFRQRTCLSAFADMLDFSSREDPAVRAHETCQTDYQKK